MSQRDDVTNLIGFILWVVVFDAGRVLDVDDPAVWKPVEKVALESISVPGHLVAVPENSYQYAVDWQGWLLGRALSQYKLGLALIQARLSQARKHLIFQFRS